MKELTKEDIKKINEDVLRMNLSAEQGIFKEPFGIPSEIKDYVIYSRYVSGGVTGGNHNSSDEDLVEFREDAPKDHMRILDVVLEKLFPDISLLQYRKLRAVTKNSTKNKYQYYGNNTDYYIEWIELKDVYSFLLTVCKIS